MTMPAKRLAPLLVAALVLLACGDAGATTPTPAPSPSATPDLIAMRTAAAARGFARPPDATASAGGSTVRLGIGTYCWSDPAGGLCVDAIGPVTASQPLTVARGEVITVMNPAAAPIREAAVDAWPAPAQPSATQTNGDLVWSLAPNTGMRLQSTITASEVQFTADLPPGRHIVQVSLQFSPNDVSYGLLLDVR
jgi:hypothetical protein